MQIMRVQGGVAVEVMVVPAGLTLAQMYGQAVVATCVEADASVQVGWVTPDGGKTFAAPPAPTLPFSTAAVLTECAGRIYAVVSDNAQKNLAANAAAGNLSAADMGSFKDGLAWIGAMQAVCRALIQASDPTYAQDTHWPTAPADAVALAARF